MSISSAGVLGAGDGAYDCASESSESYGLPDKLARRGSPGKARLLRKDGEGGSENPPLALTYTLVALKSGEAAELAVPLPRTKSLLSAESGDLEIWRSVGRADWRNRRERRK
jgi:hypothetical protein